MKRILRILLPFLLLVSCTRGEQPFNGADASDIIEIGGVNFDTIVASARDGLPFTKADGPALGYVPAEDSTWLLPALFKGMEVRYWRVNDASPVKQIAKLILQKIDPAGGNTPENILKAKNGLAVYDFKVWNGTELGDQARWQGNGSHEFQGVYVPEELIYEEGKSSIVPEDLITDQSRENYATLSHYMAMPKNTRRDATTGRIILPYGHRLARVLAYVLIDPQMRDPQGRRVTLKGFQLDDDGWDDPRTTAFGFGKVQVLKHVKKTWEGTNERLTPYWETARMVTPNFVGMRHSVNSKGEEVDTESFILYTEKETGHHIFPTSDSEWTKARNAWNAKYDWKSGTEDEKTAYADSTSGYFRKSYGLVPVYDIIARPTYTDNNNVMYDEATGTKASSNQIQFELSLTNGLSYTKTFPFQLNANYQTVVYLLINHEAVDYNEAGSDKWVEETRYDNYYGVNNRNDNALSKTGSSWQRAYRIGDKKSWDTVTDGHNYSEDGGTAPEDTDTLRQYVTAEKWKEMFLQAYVSQDTTVYGKHHGDYFILEDNITIDMNGTKDGTIPYPFIFTGHLDCQNHTITLLHASDTTYVSGKAPKWVETTDYTLEGICELKDDKYVPFTLPEHLYVLYDGQYEEVESPTLQQFMGDTGVTYYVKNSDGQYVEFPRPAHLYVWYPGEIEFITPSSLFNVLNGAYSADAGTANVYEQNGRLVPYVDEASKTGWRAEILNARVKGGSLFPAQAFHDGAYDVNYVSGYVFNCWKVLSESKKERIPDHIPALPKY